MRLEGRTIVVLLAASLSASGCSVPAGGKAVPIGERLRQVLIVIAFADEDLSVAVGTGHGFSR